MPIQVSPEDTGDGTPRIKGWLALRGHSCPRSAARDVQEARRRCGSFLTERPLPRNQGPACIWQVCQSDWQDFPLSLSGEGCRGEFGMERGWELLSPQNRAALRGA